MSKKKGAWVDQKSLNIALSYDIFDTADDVCAFYILIFPKNGWYGCLHSLSLLYAYIVMWCLLVEYSHVHYEQMGVDVFIN